MKKKRIPNKAELLLGEKLKELRIQADMSRRQLGRKVHKLEQQIEKYENGDLIPLAVLEEIAKTLDIPIQKRVIRRISLLRKREINTQVEQEELSEIYTEMLDDS